MRNEKKIPALFVAVLLSLNPAPAAAEPGNEPIVQTDSSKTIVLDPLSVSSLLIDEIDGNQVIGRATGFTMEKEGRQYLITNWHVVTGKHPQTGKIEHPNGRVPDKLAVYFHGPDLGKTWARLTLPLYREDGSHTWIEHKRGREIDVVALPIEGLKGVTIYPIAADTADSDIEVGLAAPVSIIGFPEGLTGPRMFPIWKTGHVASEMGLDYRGAPRFLIDATTRPCMSGSPVFYRAWLYKTGNSLAMTTGLGKTKFLGVYSGRIGGDTDIGVVWRPSVIDDLLPSQKN